MPLDSLSDSGIESQALTAHRPVVMGTRHMAVAGHYLAAHAAFHILEAGGNAVDAGVAAGIALGVEALDGQPLQALGLVSIAAQPQHPPQVVQHRRRQVVQAHAVGGGQRDRKSVV